MSADDHPAALLAFFAARLDEDEAISRTAAMSAKVHMDGYADGDWSWLDSYGQPQLADLPLIDHQMRFDPARVLRDVAADRALLGALEEARKFSDHMFASSSPEGVAHGEVPGQRMRAATQVQTLERVVAIRAARFSDNPDYRPEWAP
jgi:hypothetical protein